VIYTYQYKTLAADEGEVITNVAAVSAVFKPVREGYEDVPLADDDSAAITVVGIPITGETDNNSLFAGLALILAGVVALILRRRHGHQPMDN
jgi:LPXTG-motif cell wall-anchored protein